MVLTVGIAARSEFCSSLRCSKIKIGCGVRAEQKVKKCSWVAAQSLRTAYVLWYSDTLILCTVIRICLDAFAYVVLSADRALRYVLLAPAPTSSLMKTVTADLIAHIAIDLGSCNRETIMASAAVSAAVLTALWNFLGPGLGSILDRQPHSNSIIAMAQLPESDNMHMQARAQFT